jgi:hypothetical protein
MYSMVDGTIESTLESRKSQVPSSPFPMITYLKHVAFGLAGITTLSKFNSVAQSKGE